VALDAILAAHTHIVTPDPTSITGFGTLPSLTLAVGTTIDSVGISSLDFPSHQNQLIDIAATTTEYLSSDGPKYILSKYNTTN